MLCAILALTPLQGVMLFTLAVVFIGLITVATLVIGPLVDRPAATTTCCGCGIQHSQCNKDGSFSAFCTDECYHRTMAEISEPRCSCCMQIPVDGYCDCTHVEQQIARLDEDIDRECQRLTGWH